MGKRIIAQRRGRGTSTYKVPPKGFKVRPRYSQLPGKVVDIVNDSGRNSPIAVVQYKDGSTGYVVAPLGLKVGDTTDKIILPLSQIPESVPIFAIETSPNSGPKLCNSSGSFAMLFSRGRKECVVQLPSRKKKTLNPACRATLGIPAGGGRKEKPWIKAGKKFAAMHARGRLYPRTSGVEMNPVDHPYGGSSGPGTSLSVSRHAPPGRKVGSISSKRTGRRK